MLSKWYNFVPYGQLGEADQLSPVPAWHKVVVVRHTEADTNELLLHPEQWSATFAQCCRKEEMI